MAGLRFVLDIEAPGAYGPQSSNRGASPDRRFNSDEVQPQLNAEGRTESKQVIQTKQYLNQ